MCQKTQKISKKNFWLASLAKNVQNMSKYPKYVIFIKKAEYVISTYSHIFLESIEYSSKINNSPLTLKKS